MNKQTETALKMAIEAMQSAYSSHGKILPSYLAQDAWMFHGCDEKLSKALQACKEALEQPEQEYLTRAQQVIRANNSAQEPVAWMHRHEGEITEFNDFQSCDKCEPLYTHPAPSWQGLSDTEYMVLASNFTDDENMVVNEIGFARAIEQALRSKNDR